MGRIEYIRSLLKIIVLRDKVWHKVFNKTKGTELEETWHVPPCPMGPSLVQDKVAWRGWEGIPICLQEGGWQRLSGVGGA